MQLAYGQADWVWCCNEKLPEAYTPASAPTRPCPVLVTRHAFSLSSWFKRLHISLLKGDRGRRIASQCLSFEQVVLPACWVIS